MTLPILSEKPSHDTPPSRHDADADADADADTNQLQLQLQLHPLPDSSSLLVKIRPPPPPANTSRLAPHTPCDVVLVVDVSGSMAAEANVPGEAERTGLSVLDLVKHAAKTILESMDSRDRLGIVTFGARSTVVQGLMSVAYENRKTMLDNIDSMRANGATNLWHGILDGFKVLREAPRSHNVPALMVLTDGLPNHMCPSVGYIPKLRSMGPFPGTIHTFGFGYRLRSGLLKSIAEVGGGGYAFIPDAGMIGTVFVHAAANLQSTFATGANLRLTFPADLDIESAAGESGEQRPAALVDADDGDGAAKVLDIALGNLQYSQPRDILLRVANLPSAPAGITAPPPLVRASVLFHRAASPIAPPARSTSSGWSHFSASLRRKAPAPPPPSRVAVARSLLDPADLPAAELAYHESRARICRFLSDLFPASPKDGERRCRKLDADTYASLPDSLALLVADLPARAHSQRDDANASLVEDLVGDDPHGQVSLAVNDQDHFRRWGVHYLLSYLDAHTRQACNSFKDPGPLLYGAESPLFLACRDRLDAAFDRLPAPQPSADGPPAWHATGIYGPSSHTTMPGFSMSSYNRCSAPCFAAATPVELACGATVPISRLRRGTRVRTPAGPRRVAMVLKTPVHSQILCRVGDLVVTPWHPISRDGYKTWSFPARVADGPVVYTGAIYSVLLQQGRRPDAHAIRVAGAWGVTLGHGVTRGGDVRAHEFLGNWVTVAKTLAALGPDARGVVVGGGVEKDQVTGRVCGFKAPDSREPVRRRLETTAT
jgi:hypothetical protein